MSSHPLEKLAAIDPEIAERLAVCLVNCGLSPEDETVLNAVTEIARSLESEAAFGRSVADGVMALAISGGVNPLAEYTSLVSEAGRRGPTMGWLMATYLVPVLRTGDADLLAHFQKTVQTMAGKGTYTMKAPLEAATTLIGIGETVSARMLLDLLIETFSKNITYSQGQHFSHRIPRIVMEMAPSKRYWQTAALTRVVRKDIHLGDSFSDGLGNGLSSLSREALEAFVEKGLTLSEGSRSRAKAFLSLSSSEGEDSLYRLKTSVSFQEVAGAIGRYAKARIGRALAVRPISSRSRTDKKDPAELVASDVRTVYLADELDVFAERKDNEALFKWLARWEIGRHEFGTYEFDLERALDRYPLLFRQFGVNMEKAGENGGDDLQRFFLVFPNGELAADLFTVFEHARLLSHLLHRYPALAKSTRRFLDDAAGRKPPSHATQHWMLAIYDRVVLQKRPETLSAKQKDRIEAIAGGFGAETIENADAETTAGCVLACYRDVEDLFEEVAAGWKSENIYVPFPAPWENRVNADLYFHSVYQWDRTSRRIKKNLMRLGKKAYRSDILRRMVKTGGLLSESDAEEILSEAEDLSLDASPSPSAPASISDLMSAGADVMREVLPATAEDADDESVFWYREWDHQLYDYLQEHVRVVERNVEGPDHAFYREALVRHGGLIRQIRRAFELMRPQGLEIMRRWIDGDEFDYRCLLDYAVERKAGRQPSDRLYIKKVKRQRDVAALLLIDMSKSTSNPVPGSGKTVMDIAKEAVVLFCEALKIVGDTFAIAGFSGTGRLAVDYFTIKDFEESLDESVMKRISSLSPQRNTRMGASVRHCVARFQTVPQKVRLLIVLSDGFPNDTGYKRAYAIEDTRRAIMEAHAENIHTHAITVNIGADAKLDDVYGAAHHSLISDIRELPGKMLRVYSNLTR